MQRNDEGSAQKRLSSRGKAEGSAVWEAETDPEPFGRGTSASPDPFRVELVDELRKYERIVAERSNFFAGFGPTAPWVLLGRANNERVTFHQNLCLFLQPHYLEKRLRDQQTPGMSHAANLCKHRVPLKQYCHPGCMLIGNSLPLGDWRSVHSDVSYVRVFTPIRILASTSPVDACGRIPGPIAPPSTAYTAASSKAAHAPAIPEWPAGPRLLPAGACQRRA